MQKRIAWILVICLAAATTFLLMVLFPFEMKEMLYPSPPPLPAVVDKTVEQLLKELEIEMRAKYPDVLKSMLPGLRDFEIDRLEQLADYKLPADIRKLYKWHNGQRDSGVFGPIPGLRFIPLQEAIKEKNNLWRKNHDRNRAQRVYLNSLIKHRKTWIPIFEDIFGDGYFYDMAKGESKGGVFYCFAESSSYIFFPTIKNLLAGAVKCYKENVFRVVTDRNKAVFVEDYYQSRPFWLEFGATNKP
jgi:cell wall assembly regulator SMI1